MEYQLTQTQNGTEMYAKAKTGNKQWIAVITGTHPKYNYEREFVAYQKPRTSKRFDGRAMLNEGDVIEFVSYTHSGKNDSRGYKQFAGGELHKIEKKDITRALEGIIVETNEPRDVDFDALDSCVTERHECEHCERVFTSARGLGVHKGHMHTEDETPAEQTNDSQALVADGGEDIRTSREVRDTPDEVRHYSADGHLYAYRDGDEHVVVSRGSDHGDKWTMHVPATRTAVVEGEHLWTIPDNWEHQFSVRHTDINTYGHYRIPETDVHVVVSVPVQDHVVDCWYGVQRVGHLEFEVASETDLDEWERYLSESEEMGDTDEDVLEAGKRLVNRWTAFTKAWESEVVEYAPEAFEREFVEEQPTTLRDLEVDPWGGYAFEAADVVYQTLEVDWGIASKLDTMLQKAHAVPSWPKVKPVVRSRKSLPEGFDIRALTEAGCSPSQAVDYLMVEILGETQTGWAKTRGKDQSTVSGNVTKAKRCLKR